MGLFLQTAIIPDCNEAAVKDTVASVAKKYSRQFETADGNTALEYHIIDLIPDACQYYTYEKGVGVLFNEDCMGYESLACAMSEELRKAVLLLYIYDGDYWGYFLYDKGLEIDRFVPMPDYFEKVTQDETAQIKGNAGIIAKYFHVDKASIEKYLVFWTGSMQRNYSEKAYADDEFGQCEDWQMADFMKKLGYPYEW